MRQELTERDRGMIRDGLSSTKLHMPIETKELAKRFSVEVWEGVCGNTTSDALIELWSKLFESFNEACLRNQSNHIFDKKNLVVPAPTGSGKTLCMRFYAAALADKGDLGMMVITKLKSEAQEAAKQINEWSKSDNRVAVAYHSNSEFTHRESTLKNCPVLVITHEQFIRNHHSKSRNHAIYTQLSKFKDGERTCIVVDESIELIQHIGISKDLIDSIAQHIVEPYTSNPKEEFLRDEYKLLSFLSSHYSSIFFQELPKKLINHIGDKRNSLIDSLTKDLELPPGKVKELFKLKETTKFITDSVVSNISNIQYLLDDNLYLYKSGNQVEYRTSTLETPLRSMVVLDATANVNKAYEYYKDIEVVELPKVKTYENVTVRLHSTKSGLGSSALIGQNIDEDRSNMQAINIFFMDSDNSVVFTFKDLKQDILKELPKLELDHFGNLTGVNTYKDKEHIIIYGMHYKPQYVYFDEQYQALGQEAFLTDNKKEIKELMYSGIAADIIQMINRGRCRGITTDNKAPKMTVELPMPNNKPLADRIKSEIVKEMSGVNIVDVEGLLRIDDSLKNTKKAVGKDTLFIDNIDTSLARVKVSEVFATIEATKKDKERISRDIGNPKYRDSYLYLTLKGMGYSAVKDGQWYLVKDL